MGTLAIVVLLVDDDLLTDMSVEEARRSAFDVASFTTGCSRVSRLGNKLGVNLVCIEAPVRDRYSLTFSLVGLYGVR